jgi:hypothetical protein
MILGIGICGRIDTQIIGKAAHFAAIFECHEIICVCLGTQIT